MLCWLITSAVYLIRKNKACELKSIFDRRLSPLEKDPKQSEDVAVDSCFAFVACQDGVTNREARLWKYPLIYWTPTPTRSRHITGLRLSEDSDIGFEIFERAIDLDVSIDGWSGYSAKAVQLCAAPKGFFFLPVLVWNRVSISTILNWNRVWFVPSSLELSLFFRTISYFFILWR